MTILASETKAPVENVNGGIVEEKKAVKTTETKNIRPPNTSEQQKFEVNRFEVWLPKDDVRYRHKLTEDILYKGTTSMLHYPEAYYNSQYTAENLLNETAHLLKWADELQLPRSSSDDQESLCLCVPSFVTCIMPNVQVGTLQFRAMEYWNFFFTYMDDFLDDILVKKTDKVESKEVQDEKFCRITKELEFLAQIFEGKEEPCLVLENEPTCVPNLKYCARIARSMYETLDTCVTDYLERSKPFLKAMRMWFGTPLWRYGRNNTSRTMRTSEMTYLYFRSVNFGSYMFFEFLPLLNDIIVPDWVRHEPDFIRYQGAIANVFGVSNDVYSVGKEMIDDETENLVLHKMANKKYDFFKSVEECVRLINEETEEARIYSERVMKKFPESKELYGFFKILSFLHDGHQIFFGKVRRYGKVTLRPEWIDREEYQELSVHPDLKIKN